MTFIDWLKTMQNSPEHADLIRKFLSERINGVFLAPNEYHFTSRQTLRKYLAQRRWCSQNIRNDLWALWRSYKKAEPVLKRLHEKPKPQEDDVSMAWYGNYDFKQVYADKANILIKDTTA